MSGANARTLRTLPLRDLCRSLLVQCIDQLELELHCVLVQ
nr:MAG TPA: hypothetical protein [Bacteriophage sp.]